MAGRHTGRAYAPRGPQQQTVEVQSLTRACRSACAEPCHHRQALSSFAADQFVELCRLKHLAAAGWGAACDAAPSGDDAKGRAGGMTTAAPLLRSGKAKDESRLTEADHAKAHRGGRPGTNAVKSLTSAQAPGREWRRRKAQGPPRESRATTSRSAFISSGKWPAAILKSLARSRG
ncbi:hypothetical protein BDY21DRAFT_60061 [Lineolata rhizophorae]|uniref:Uncharacterized protein n=1 Tax=Lineolata rhizophorae TaxID=578093 RepID=A0A6A6NWV9_9PEZI|nr:hypothetical protein BDY21DRAFT_60061 [Lineolata rhizophorae]